MLLAIGCGVEPETNSGNHTGRGEPAGSHDRAAARDSLLLIDATQDSGLDYRHYNGMDGNFQFAEMMGPGVALFDADGDGDLDLLFTQGQPLTSDSQPPDGIALGARLYRNELLSPVDEEATHGQLRFTDITELSGLAAEGYGMGVATGDIDNDGWVDLYLTYLGRNQLWRNLGPGPDGVPRFTELSATSSSDDSRWTLSAAMLDLDRDGWLDLYAVNYVDYRVASSTPCFTELGALEYCGPRSFKPESDLLLRNLGQQADGTARFVDISGPAGLLSAPGPGLGVVTADFDGDGWNDVYVANDQAHNHLWLNRPDGRGGRRLKEEALLRGAAVDGQGRAQASMGVEAGDVDGDGDEDLFMTHLLLELNTLYVNDGRGQFRDRSAASGLGQPSIGSTGFGTALADLDRDGWLDLVVANGAVRTIAEQRAAGDPLPLRQPDQVFQNHGGRFEDATQNAPALSQSLVSRALAAGDVDNDGDTDLVITHNNGPARLLLATGGDGQPWLGARLLGGCGDDQPCLRDALGAKVGLHRPGRPTLWRQVRSAASYLAAHDPRVLFGLGGGSEAMPTGSWLEVCWPLGAREAWDQPSPGRYMELVKGEGRPLSSSAAGQQTSREVVVPARCGSTEVRPS